MRECLRVVVVWAMVVGVMATGAAAETTLEKINRTGIFTVGTRTASPPFGFINKQNEWVGFSIDLARLVHKNIEKRLKNVRSPENFIAKSKESTTEESTPHVICTLGEGRSALTHPRPVG